MMPLADAALWRGLWEWWPLLVLAGFALLLAVALRGAKPDELPPRDEDRPHGDW